MYCSGATTEVLVCYICMLTVGGEARCVVECGVASGRGGMKGMGMFGRSPALSLLSLAEHVFPNINTTRT
jgi:hypothetical protein